MKTNRFFFFFLRRQSFGNGYITVRRAPSLQALGLSFLHPHLGSSGPPVSRACWLMTNGVGHFPKEITTKPCRPARCPFVGSVSFSFFHFYSCPIGFDFHLYHCSSVDILFLFSPGYLLISFYFYFLSLCIYRCAKWPLFADYPGFWLLLALCRVSLQLLRRRRWRRFGIYRRLPETGVSAYRLAVATPVEGCPTSAVSRLRGAPNR